MRQSNVKHKRQGRHLGRSNGPKLQSIEKNIPKLRVILMKGNDLDAASLETICKMAAEKDYQLWIEKVSDDKKNKTGFIYKGDFMATKQIPIKDVCIDGKTQHRPVEDKVVTRYAAMMKEGSVFPPVEIITDGKSNFLTDGFHRYFATKRLGKKYIEAAVEKGTQRRAMWLSFSANKKNAFPRQPGTGKDIVGKILKDEEWSKISEVEIAKWVGVTHQYVNKIKKEIEAHPATSCRIDSGSESKNKVLRSETVKVKRGGSGYEMKKPAKKVLDSTGKQVPEHLVKYFERANEYRQMIKQLNDMLKTVRKGKEANDLFYKYIKIENLTAEIGNVKRIFRFAMPYAVCRYCGGDENNAECRACDGCGFVNEAVYRATPPDLK